MLYTSKKFCELTGITPETLRHYAELGLLEPAEVQENGYRKYSIENAIDLFYLRHERHLGFNLDQLHPEKEALSLQEKKVRYQNELDELNEKKRHLERQIERNYYYQELIQRAMYQEKKPIFTITSNQLFDLSFLEFPKEGQEQEVLDTISCWMRKAELLHLAFRIDLNVLPQDGFYVPKVGLGIRTDFALEEGLPLKPAVTKRGSNKIVTLIGKAPSLCQISCKTLQPLLEEIEKNGGNLKQELIGRMITRVKEDGQQWYYFSCAADLKKE